MYMKCMYEKYLIEVFYVPQVHSPSPPIIDFHEIH